MIKASHSFLITKGESPRGVRACVLDFSWVTSPAPQLFKPQQLKAPAYRQAVSMIQKTKYRRGCLLYSNIDYIQQRPVDFSVHLTLSLCNFLSFVCSNLNIFPSEKQHFTIIIICFHSSLTFLILPVSL